MGWRGSDPQRHVTAVQYRFIPAGIARGLCRRRTENTCWHSRPYDDVGKQSFLFFLSYVRYIYIILYYIIGYARVAELKRYNSILYIYVLYRNPIKNRRFSESGETYKSCVCGGGGERIASAKCGRPFENRHASIPRAVFIGFIRRVPNHTNTLADRNTRKGSFKRRRSLPIRPDKRVCNIRIPIYNCFRNFG